MSADDLHEISLAEDEELRVSQLDDKAIEIELIQGSAEIFGYELQKIFKYRFDAGVTFSIFTYQGCKLHIFGKAKLEKSKETPMIMYLQTHAALEELRKVASDDLNQRGPSMMIAGPTDSGKSTMARLLLNYAVRMGRTPVFVDLDVGQGSISIPGTIGACVVEEQVNITDSFDKHSPIIYSYGHKAPGQNLALINSYISKLAETIFTQFKHNRKAETSGIIINTCGWIKGQGYEHLKHIAQAFEIDLVVVLDEERLYKDMLEDMPSFVKVTWLPKAIGVQIRDQPYRIKSRKKKIEEYFYGRYREIEPFTFELDFSELKHQLYKVYESSDEKSKVDEFKPNQKNINAFKNHLLALSYAKNEEQLLTSNVAGFICVTEVDFVKQKITVLSPQPEPLPKFLMLLSDIQYMN